MNKKLQDLHVMIGNAMNFAVCRTEDKADSGQLEWLPEDGQEDDESCLEVITRGQELAFELAIDEDGDVRNTVVVRTTDGQSYGVPLSIEKLAHLARWALDNTFHQLDLLQMDHIDTQVSAIAKSMSAREVKTTLKVLFESSPDTFVSAFDKKLTKDIVKTAEKYYQDKLAAAELKLRLELEKKYSAPILKLAEAITTSDEAILDDPLLQNTLIRARRLQDDGAK